MSEIDEGNIMHARQGNGQRSAQIETIKFRDIRTKSCRRRNCYRGNASSRNV